jgi:hypothetical protein
MRLDVHLRLVAEKDLFLVQFSPDAVKAGKPVERLNEQRGQ